MDMQRRKELGQYNKERIIELRHQHPEMTLEEIGNEVSLTKERVRQVLTKENLSTKSSKLSPNFSTVAKPIQPCINCGSLEKNFISKHTAYCGNDCVAEARDRQWKQFHQDHPDRRTTYQCEYCGTDKTIRTGIYERQIRTFNKLYCSHACSIKAQWDNKNSALRNQPRWS